MNYNLRLVLLFLLILIIWGSIFALLWFKADEVTKNPCAVCAESIGKGVFCYTGMALNPEGRFFYPNGSIGKS